MVIKQEQNSKNSKKHHGAKLLTEEREVNGQACFLSKAVFYFSSSQRWGKVSAAEVPCDKEIHHLITSRTFGHPDPGDFALLLKYLLITPLLKTEALRSPSSCQLSPKPPKIHRCLPILNTEFWNIPKKPVSRQVLTILTSWEGYIPASPYCLLESINKFFFCLHPELTANPEDASHAWNAMGGSSSITAQGRCQSREWNSGFTALRECLAHGLFGFILATVQPRKFKFFSTNFRSFYQGVQSSHILTPTSVRSSPKEHDATLNPTPPQEG